MGNGKCYHHGGKTPVGIACVNFKDGSHSKYFPRLPARMQDDYKAAIADDNYLSLRDEQAVARARSADLLSRVDSGESGELWRSVRETWIAGEKALAMWNAGGETIAGKEGKSTYFEAWEQIGILTSEGIQDYQSWDEWHKNSEGIRRLSETEVKRIKAAQDALTKEQALMYAVATQQAILKHVKDRDTLAAIAADLAALGVVPTNSHSIGPGTVG